MKTTTTGSSGSAGANATVSGSNHGTREQRTAPARRVENPLDGKEVAFTVPTSKTGEGPNAILESPARRDLTPQTRRKLRRISAGVAALAVLAVVLWGGLRWLSYAHTWVLTDNAYVAAHIHTISPRVAGTVIEVLAEENQQVAAGAVLARLDQRDFEVRRQQAQAQLAQAQAKVQQAKAEAAQAGAEVSRQQARQTKAVQDLERASKLYQDNAAAISKQEFDQSKAEAAAAGAALQGAEAALQSAGALIAAAEAQEKVARANLQDAELQLSYTEIRAPAAGRIGRKNVELGNRVQPGQALLALVQPGVWVTANYKETQLARMRPGQAVRVKIDAFPGQEFAGKVDSLSPASGAQFALLPPDNATGNFTKIVQRVAVKIVFDEKSLAAATGAIVPGMSAVVRVQAAKG